MIVKPFRGFRPRADLASRIPSYPYDVVTEAEARALTRDDPWSFLHVVRPEVDLPPGTDPHAPEVYERGRRNFRALIEQGALVRDERPAYYVYRLTAGGRSQTGIVGATRVSEYLEHRVRRHEHTRPDKVADRTRLNEALAAHPGPVFCAYRSQEALSAWLADSTLPGPRANFVAPDGVEHALWVVEAPGEIERVEALLAALPACYIADGHHRAAAAAELAGRVRARTDNPTGEEPFNFFMTVLFRSDELRILDYNRVVRDLAGLDPPSFLTRARESGFDVVGARDGGRPPRRGTFGAYVGGGWHLLVARPEIANNDPVEGLDVSILTSRLLQPVLGIGDPRTDRRIDFVGGSRGMEELERLVKTGQHAIAFALWPTSLEDVMRVADSGRVMPPKSTWFEPKLRSGLVVQSIEGNAL